LKLDKEYIATVRLGATSTTGDPEGEVTVVRDVRVPSRVDVEKAVEKFVGETEQRVPSYSAVKINGERAYKLARAGKEVEMPVRKVRIDEIEILDYKWPDLTIRCQVSSGTYIRALGEDIGKELGVGGYLTALRRTQVGEWRIEEAKRLEELGIDS
jgi:tRNA pseudouridine55 synthase